jgi:hypothetical protein
VKTAVLCIFAFFGAFFIRQEKSAGENRTWPEQMPRFAEGVSNYAFSFSGGSEFVSFSSAMMPDAALETARLSFADAGWETSAVRTRDMLVFTKNKSVAAVLARPDKTGSRVTAILRSDAL